ncbi:MAG: hypothetical protein JWM09_399 [Francisellaceae bacterium]|nr:hypothetical protein [Francisellaceae bacterium]
MAGKKSKKGVLIKLESTAGTGTFYTRKKNPKLGRKLEFKMFDKKIRQHVLFVEKRLK